MFQCSKNQPNASNKSGGESWQFCSHVQRDSLDLKLREITIFSSTMNRSEILVGGGKLDRVHGITGLRLRLGKHIPNSDYVQVQWWVDMAQASHTSLTDSEVVCRQKGDSIGPSQWKYLGRLENGLNTGYTSLYSERPMDREQEPSYCSRCSNAALVPFVVGL